MATYQFSYICLSLVLEYQILLPQQKSVSIYRQCQTEDGHQCNELKIQSDFGQLKSQRITKVLQIFSLETMNVFVQYLMSYCLHVLV